MDNNFCSLEPNFPLSAFVLMLFVTRGDEMTYLYPLSDLYTMLSDLPHTISNLVASLERETDLHIFDEVLLLPVNFNRLFLLRESYWQTPSEHFDMLHRVTSFLSVTKAPGLFQLLVTPSVVDESGKWFFSAALPLYHNTPTYLIEKFMQYSDHPVDTRAKSAALYTFSTVQQLNWQTGEMTILQQAKADDLLRH